MRRQTAVVVVAAALVLLLALAVSGADRVWFIENDHRADDSSQTDPRERLSNEEDTGPADADPTISQDGLGRWFDIVATVVLAIIAIVLLTAIFKRTQARRRRRQMLRAEAATGRAQPSALAEPIHVPAELIAATDDLDVEMLQGTPRNAIVKCWVALEEGCSRVGVTRHPAETSVEFTSRVLGTFSLTDTSIDALAALYREARFSTHDMTEQHRASAIAALGAVQAQLRGSQAEVPR